MKRIFIFICIQCLVFGLFSCALKREESKIDDAGKTEENARIETVRSADGVEVSIKELCRIPVGEGEGHVKCRKIPGADYCPSSISFTENGDICVTDCEGKKAEIFSRDGKHVKTVGLALTDHPDSLLTYAVYSKGYIYAIFDQNLIYRFDQSGEAALITSSGQYIMLDVSQTDGRVVVFGIGSIEYITNEGKLTREDDFGNTAYKTDTENFNKVTEVRYKRDGKDVTFKVNTSSLSECVGIVNGFIVLKDYDGNNSVYTAFDQDGVEQFVLLKNTFENDLSPVKSAFEYGGKMYLLICGEDYTTVTEISVGK